MASCDFKNSRDPKPVVTKHSACAKCGGTKFREANRIANPKGGKDSVMFECVECGEYRL